MNQTQTEKSILRLLISLTLAGNCLYLPISAASQSQVLVTVAMCLVFGEVVLLVIWLALSEATLSYRIWIATVFAGLFWFSIVISGALAQGALPIATAVLWFVVQIATMTPALALFGTLRLCGYTVSLPIARVRTSQFGLWRLFVWMTVVAALLAIGMRAIDFTNWDMSPTGWPNALTIGGAMGIAITLIAAPLLWAILSDSMRLFAMVIAAVITIAVPLVSVGLFAISQGSSPPVDAWVEIAALTGCPALAVFFLAAALMLIGRRMGMRFRHGARAKTANDTTSKQ